MEVSTHWSSKDTYICKEQRLVPKFSLRPELQDWLLFSGLLRVSKADFLLSAWNYQLPSHLFQKLYQFRNFPPGKRLRWSLTVGFFPRPCRKNHRRRPSSPLELSDDEDILNGDRRSCLEGRIYLLVTLTGEASSVTRVASCFRRNNLLQLCRFASLASFVYLW